MLVAATYSFKDGQALIEWRYPALLREIHDVIAEVALPLSPVSPISLQTALDEGFGRRGWQKSRITYDLPTGHYTPEFRPRQANGSAIRELDWMKDSLGVELQPGSYQAQAYNACAKLTIFKNLGMVEAGVEILPVQELADRLAPGSSHFEQFVWDLEARGVADIDVPVPILGIAA